MHQIWTVRCVKILVRRAIITVVEVVLTFKQANKSTPTRHQLWTVFFGRSSIYALHTMKNVKFQTAIKLLSAHANIAQWIDIRSGNTTTFQLFAHGFLIRLLFQATSMLIMSTTFELLRQIMSVLAWPRVPSKCSEIFRFGLTWLLSREIRT